MENEDISHQLVCDINHPLFDVIDNTTRRQVLRLIACEHNYGNRIASIMDLSTPAIHRHLKYLSGKNPGELQLIGEGHTTNESYSGYKGGKATLFEVTNKIGLFFTIMPNFVHSHVLDLYEDPKKQGEIIEPPAELKNLRPRPAENISEKNKSQKKLSEIYEIVQKTNKTILQLEKDLMQAMDLKNDWMQGVDDILKADKDLEYEDRVILRAITCLGEHCSSDLSHLLNMDNFQIMRFVENLRKNGWIE